MFVHAHSSFLAHHHCRVQCEVAQAAFPAWEGRGGGGGGGGGGGSFSMDIFLLATFSEDSACRHFVLYTYRYLLVVQG